MTGTAQAGSLVDEKALMLTPMWLVASRASCLGKRSVQIRLLHPALDFHVAGATKRRSRLDQEAFVITAVGLVALRAFTLLDWVVNEGARDLILQLGVTSLAEGPWSVLQECREPGNVRIVASGAAPFCNGLMRHS